MGGGRRVKGGWDGGKETGGRDVRRLKENERERFEQTETWSWAVPIQVEYMAAA